MIDYRIGDTRDLTADLPDGSVHLVASSPPFVALRSYLPADHPDKHREIGSEPDPATFLDTLLALTAEWGRVLAPWGSIAIELGDTYAGSGGAGGDYNEGGVRDGQNAFVGSSKHARRTDTKRTKVMDESGIGGGIRDLHGKVQGGGAGWPRPKCLALVPQAYALSLAYGRNILTGQPSPAGQWLVRNMVVWHRPNPAVGALGDKYRPSTSYITVATRSSSRWFDLTAVRGEPSPNTHARTAKGVEQRETTGKTADKDGNFHTLATQHLSGGAPPLDCWFDEHDTWTITTQPSKLAHYAMWPPKLAERLVLSMCPEWVCRVCGQPRRRMEGKAEYVRTDSDRVPARLAARDGDRVAEMVNRFSMDAGANTSVIRTAPTIGWSDCGHDDYGPGVVLDPFAGTGTTLCVADLHNRTGVGFDIDPRNADLVPARRAEVARAMFGTRPELPGQLELL